MPMNIDGDFVNRFGNRLPVPYMEKIIIRDAAFEIQISFYIKPPDFEKINQEFYEQYINSLQDLKVAIVTVNDGTKTDPIDHISGLTPESDAQAYYEKYGPISNATTGTGLFHSLNRNDTNILQIATPTDRVYEADSTDSAAMEVFHIEQVRSFDDLSFVPPNASTVIYCEPMALSEYNKEVLYDSTGHEVHKYTRNVMITHDDSRVNVGHDTLVAYVNKMLDGLRSTFVAFTTSLSQFPNGFSAEQREQIVNRQPAAEVMFTQVSDLSYEQVSADKTIKGSEIVIFKTAAGDMFDGNIFQSIDGSYYGNASLTNDDIINTFTDLIATTSDKDLQHKFDELAFILMVHGKEVNILAKINEFRKTFTETSTAVPVGRMHEKLEIRLFNTNNAVKRGIPLQKLFNMSPTVVDGRERLTLPYTPPEIDPSYDIAKATNYIYTKRAKIGAYALPTGFSWSTEDARIAAEELEANLNAQKEVIEGYELECEQAYRRIIDSILDAFDTLNDEKGDQFNEGIPEFVFSKGRMTWTNYISMASDIEALKPQILGASGNPAMELFITRDETMMDPGRGNHPSLDTETWDLNNVEQETPVEVKIWPFDVSYTAKILNDAGIKWGPRGVDQKTVWASHISELMRSATYREVTDSPLDKWRAKVYMPIVSATSGMDWTSQKEKDVAQDKGWDWSGGIIGAFEEWGEEAEGQNIDRSSAQIEGMKMRLLISELDTVSPNTFVEVATMLKYAFHQSGTSTNIVTYDDSKGEWAGIDWTGSDDDSSVKTVTWDKEAKVHDAYIGFLEAYQLYVESLILGHNIRQALQETKQVAALGGEAGVDLIYTDYNLYFTGFIFFDYEKALKKASTISKAFDVAKIEKLFGDRISHTYFKVLDAKLEKFWDKKYDDMDSTIMYMDHARQPTSDLVAANPHVAFQGDADDYISDESDGSIYARPTPADYGNSAVLYDSRYPSEPQPLGDITSYAETNSDDHGMPTMSPYTENYNRFAVVLPNLQHTVRHSRQYGAEEAKGAKIGTYVDQPAWGTPGLLTDEKREYTFLIPRSFQFSDSNAPHDYRLVCYQFQDVAGSFSVGAGADGHGQPVHGEWDNCGGNYGADYLFDQNQFGNSYIMQIRCHDRTKDMYAQFVRTLTRAILEYEEYYQAIIEECSHDMSDERMNKFFIDGVIDRYSSAPHMAPWYRVPLVYHAHMDLVLDQHGGSWEEIKAAAIDLSQRLHPSNVTLTEAESFRDIIRSFFEVYYQIGTGAVTEAISEHGYTKTITFGGDGSESGYVAIMPRLPKPVNLDYLGYSYMTGDVVAVESDDIDV